MTKGEAAGYVAAMVDGEGTIAYQIARSGPREGKPSRRAVSVCNTEQDIIEGYVEACGVLGLRTCVYGYQDNRNGEWSYRWDVNISGRAQLQKFASLVTLRSVRKKARLQEMLDSYEETQRGWGDVPVDELRRLYIDERRSMSQVAAALGVKSACTIHRWLHRAGIPTRAKGFHHR